MGEDWASTGGRARLRGLLADEARLLDEYQSQADRGSPKAIRLWSEHDEADARLEQARYEALGPLLDALDAAEREAGLLREPMPCGHPGAVQVHDELGSYCPMCIDGANLRHLHRLRADITAARDIAATRGGVPGRGYAESAVDSVTWLVEALEEARADLAEARLRLAIWSGEGVPEGWEAAADGEPYLVRRRGEWAVTLDPLADGGAAWAGWWRLGECERCEEREYQRTATVTEALAAAEAWLAGVAP